PITCHSERSEESRVPHPLRNAISDIVRPHPETPDSLPPPLSFCYLHGHSERSEESPLPVQALRSSGTLSPGALRPPAVCHSERTQESPLPVQALRSSGTLSPGALRPPAVCHSERSEESPPPVATTQPFPTRQLIAQQIPAGERAPLA